MTLISKSGMQVIRVTVQAEGPVLVMRFSDKQDDAFADDQAERKLQSLDLKLSAIDAELGRYEEEHGKLVNVMLGHRVRATPQPTELLCDCNGLISYACACGCHSHNSGPSMLTRPKN